MSEVKETKKIEPRTKKKDITEKNEEENAQTITVKRLIRPQITMCINEDSTGYIGEILLPGVEKTDISLRMSENFLTIDGERENIRYRGTYFLNCSVDPKTATASYKEDLLEFSVDLKEPKLSTIDIEIH
ncbi:MAG: Hsp20/alpha crystallin family protein [Promethearchaeia archaeon]